MTTTEITPSTGGFAPLGLGEHVLRGIADLGYVTPTPIQAQTIELMLAGTDVIAQAQTGTGKTAAFALPILERIDPLIRVPQALVMAPTRELAVQVADALESFSKYQPIAVAAVYGGQPIGLQLRALRNGVHVVVGTPGRILDHIRRGTLDLSNIRTVVLDEADVMLDMGFIEDIETILSSTPAERQTALFSATMPAPIAALAQTHMRTPARVTVQAQQLTAEAVTQSFYEIGQRDKFEVLARILDFEQPSSAIIFCRTKRDVDMLGQKLIARNLPAETLHGDLSQMQRDRVMARFRSNQVVLLVATDVAARGLDIEHVSHVINFDIPTEPEVYVHRIGRTARAGRSGNAITLVSHRELRMLTLIERIIKTKIVRKRVPTLQDVAEKRNAAISAQLRSAIAAGEGSAYAPLIAELGQEFEPAQVAAAALHLLLGAPADPAEDVLARYEPEANSERSTGDRYASRRDRFGGPRGAERGGRFGERRERGEGYGERRGFSEGRNEGRSEGFGERGERFAEPRGERFGGPRSSEGYDAPRGGGRRRNADGPPEQGMTRVYLDVGRYDGVRPADIVGAIANEAGVPGRTIGAIQLYDRSSTVELPSDKAERVLRALRSTTVRGIPIAPSLTGGRSRRS